jgi:hypothetical protein
LAFQTDRNELAYFYWVDGVLEYWSNEYRRLGQYSITPILHCSISFRWVTPGE